LLGQLPARLTAEQAAWVLNCQPHDVDETKLARLFERFRADEVSIPKSSAACLLGSLKKGRTEVPSPIKQQVARANGRKGGRPCRQSGDRVTHGPSGQRNEPYRPT
jgi:hypothetical protein